MLYRLSSLGYLALFAATSVAAVVPETRPLAIAAPFNTDTGVASLGRPSTALAAAPTCQGPAVRQTTRPLAADGDTVTVIQVSLEAAASLDQGDRLTGVRFTHATNGTIEANDAQVPVPSTISLPSIPAWSFTFTKTDVDAPMTVAYVVTDLCGDVSKFAGAGVGSTRAAAPGIQPAVTAIALVENRGPADLPTIPGFEALTDGAVISLASLPARLNLRYTVNGATRSTKTTFDGQPVSVGGAARVDADQPFTGWATTSGGTTLTPGTHTLIVTPYATTDGSGSSGPATTLRFTVRTAGSTPVPTQIPVPTKTPVPTNTPPPTSTPAPPNVTDLRPPGKVKSHQILFGWYTAYGWGTPTQDINTMKGLTIDALTLSQTPSQYNGQCVRHLTDRDLAIPCAQDPNYTKDSRRQDPRVIAQIRAASCSKRVIGHVITDKSWIREFQGPPAYDATGRLALFYDPATGGINEAWWQAEFAHRLDQAIADGFDSIVLDEIHWWFVPEMSGPQTYVDANGVTRTYDSGSHAQAAVDLIVRSALYFRTHSAFPDAHVYPTFMEEVLLSHPTTSWGESIWPYVSGVHHETLFTDYQGQRRVDTQRLASLAQLRANISGGGAVLNMDYTSDPNVLNAAFADASRYGVAETIVGDPGLAVGHPWIWPGHEPQCTAF